MNPKLEITIEGCWRGCILDTVIPITKLSLKEDISIPGMHNLVDTYPLWLASDEQVGVWCALMSDGRVGFSLARENKTILAITTMGEFYIEAVLPDGKQYQFRFRNDS